MQKRPPYVEDSLLYKEKIQYMIHYVGSQIFEEYFKEEFIYQVGKFAESEGYNLLRLLPDNDNTLLTSYKTSLFQMTEIVDSIDN